MGSKQLLLISSLVVSLLMTAVPGFSQAQTAQRRIPQQVIINGQTVTAVHVVAPGGVFSRTPVPIHSNTRLQMARRKDGHAMNNPPVSGC